MKLPGERDKTPTDRSITITLEVDVDTPLSDDEAAEAMWVKDASYGVHPIRHVRIIKVKPTTQ